MHRAALLLLLAASLGGCREEAPAPPPPVADPAPAAGARRPAGEVPPHSRAPFDAGGAPAAPFAGFDYAIPGPPGVASHYHVRVPDAGAPSAGLSGDAAGTRIRLRAFRTADAVDSAAAVGRAIGGQGPAEVLDPATAGGCGGEPGHGGAVGRRPPVVRVVRVRLPAAGESALPSLPGLEAILEADLGTGGAREGWLDVHLVER